MNSVKNRFVASISKRRKYMIVDIYIQEITVVCILIQKKGRKLKLREDEIVCPTSKPVYKWRAERKR